MKKTLRTVITAAMFAAANMSAIPAAAGEANAVPQFRNDTEREVYRNFSPVYGPGPTYEVTTTTADIEEVLTTTTTTDYPVPLYGTQPPRTTTSDLIKVNAGSCIIYRINTIYSSGCSSRRQDSIHRHSSCGGR